MSTEYVCEDFRVNTDFKILCVSLCHGKVFMVSTFLPFCYFLCNKPLEKILAFGIYHEKRIMRWSRKGRSICGGTQAGLYVRRHHLVFPKAHKVDITTVSLLQTGNQESETHSNTWLVGDSECKLTSLWDQSRAFFCC